MTSKIKSVEEAGRPEGVPKDIEDRLDEFVDMCSARKIDCTCYVRPTEDAESMLSVGYSSRRMDMEVFCAAGDKLGLPVEVLQEMAIAGAMGAEIHTERVSADDSDGIEDLLRKLAESSGEEPPIH